MTALKLYLDEMLSRPAASELVKRGYEIVMAIDVEMTGKTDAEHRRCAAEHGLVLVTFDRKFASLTSHQTDHAGLICLTLERQDEISGVVRVLSHFADVHTADEAKGNVYWLK